MGSNTRLAQIDVGSSPTDSGIQFTAPSTPGQYEFRYEVAGQGAAAVSNPISVEAALADFSVEGGYAVVGPGQTIGVKWTAPNGRPARDWIALYKVGAPNTHFERWTYLNGAGAGVFWTTAPTDPGRYEFRILLDDGYTSAAVGGILEVSYRDFWLRADTGIPPGFNWQGLDLGFPTGHPIDVEFRAALGRPADDWIGMFKVGDPNQKWVDFRYVGGLQSGTVTFNAPPAAGRYEFRYLTSGGQPITFGVSNNIRVFKANLTATPASIASGSNGLRILYNVENLSDQYWWIGLFAKNGSQVLWLRYVVGNSGEFTLDAPVMNGDYEFRLMYKYDIFAWDSTVHSNIVSVGTGGFFLTTTVATSPPSSAVSVTWEAPPGRPGSDWIGIFKVGDPNTQYLSWAYTGGTVRGTITLTAPLNPGTYEFRYLLNYGYSDVARSTSFTVQ